MKKLIVVSCGLTLLLSTIAKAGSATWELNPGSGDWNTAANWTPMTVPNGAGDSATFGLSNNTNVSISANTEVNGITFGPTATNPYTILVSGHVLTLSGTGIENNSGTIQNFVAPRSSTNVFELLFKNSATAGSGTVFTTEGASAVDKVDGATSFTDDSSAANGTFINNGGVTYFFNKATAANGTFINNPGGSTPFNVGGSTQFGDNSTAANATITNNGGTLGSERSGLTAVGSTAGTAIITNNGGTVSGAEGGRTIFEGAFRTATAGNATIINNGAGAIGASAGETTFRGAILRPDFNTNAAAGDATIINNGSSVTGAAGGHTIFETSHSSQSRGISTAASATLIANGGINGGQGGRILFAGISSGGTSRIEVFGNGFLDVSKHDLPGITVGSIEGDGDVFLGANNLGIGSKNTDTTFSGVIQDGGQNGGSNGSLTKVGTGTLDLTGINTYTGNTRVIDGVLKIDGSISSNTLVEDGGTVSGTGIIHGNLTNGLHGFVRPGDDPGTLTVNSYTQTLNGTLLIDIAGASTAQYSVLNVSGTANLSGLLDPVLLNGFVPIVGDQFTFLNYGSMFGSLFIHDRNIDSVAEHWEVNFQPTFATLTVAAGNVPVPDHGSTFVLLTLGLLGLVCCRRLHAATITVKTT